MLVHEYFVLSFNEGSNEVKVNMTAKYIILVLLAKAGQLGATKISVSFYIL